VSKKVTSQFAKVTKFGDWFISSGELCKSGETDVVISGGVLQ
jgi:hypothetical protein